MTAPSTHHASYLCQPSFFAGLKKRQGVAVEAAERVRQVEPGNEGAKGSYTVYRVAKAS